MITRHRKALLSLSSLVYFCVLRKKKKADCLLYLKKIGKPHLVCIVNYFLLAPTNGQVNEILHIFFNAVS